MTKKRLTICIYGNAGILIALALYFFLIPLGILIRDLREPALYSAEIPGFVFSWHQTLSKEYASWARERVASGEATELSINDISGTEWSVFSSVFYLWATEALQKAWEEDPTLAPTMPKMYAQEAIDAAAALVSDPNHAAWVRAHWGDDYLHQENLFYRMLLISGLTSYQKLLGDDTYQALLLDQVESLARELDASPYGLLDDYPGQCYPIDILPAIAAIQRADDLLGTDHTDFVTRALRGFEDTRLDPHTGLPAYIADSKTGQGVGPARGVGISYMLIWAPELWPETAQQWYGNYEKHFWQEGSIIAGFRELSKERVDMEWFWDVDAGPVLSGYGTTASVFGIGATRINGRFDQAYPLTAQALIASWPLPNETRLGTRLLSNLSDAPYVGESILLFNLTRRPINKNNLIEKSSLPFSIYLGLFLYAAAGMIGVGLAIVSIRRWPKRRSKRSYPVPHWQLLSWFILVLAGAIITLFLNPSLGILLLLLAQFLPRSQKSNLTS